MKYLLVFLVVAAGTGAWAQTKFVERTVDVKSTEKNAVTARQQLIQQATQTASEDLIKEIIGESKFNRNKSLIDSKVIKNSARFLPTVKAGDLKTDAEGFKMSVTLRLSMDDLQALLLENGLFYEQDSTPIAVPFVRFADKVNLKTFAWWSSEESSQRGFLVKASRNFENAMKAALQKNNFYLLRAQNLKYAEVIPNRFRVEQLRLEDQQALATQWNAQISIDGEVQVQKSQERSEAFVIKIKWVAIQNLNGRVIAEVVRTQETDPGSFEIVVDRKWKELLEPAAQDLASQILEAWQKGAIGASLYRLSVLGKIPIPVQEALKEVIKSQLKDVKNVKERLISSEGVSYEIDSSIGPQEIAQKMPNIESLGMKFVVNSSNEKEVSYKIAK